VNATPCHREVQTDIFPSTERQPFPPSMIGVPSSDAFPPAKSFTGPLLTVLCRMPFRFDVKTCAAFLRQAFVSLNASNFNIFTTKSYFYSEIYENDINVISDLNIMCYRITCLQCVVVGKEGRGELLQNGAFQDAPFFGTFGTPKQEKG
jgi:hypothetical protein